MAQARRTKKSKTPAWAWVLVGILLGFFFAHVNFSNLFQFLAKAFEQDKTATTSTSQKNTEKKEPKFDFYNLLSEKTPIKTNPSSPQAPRKTQEKALHLSKKAPPPQIPKIKKQAKTMPTEASKNAAPILERPSPVKNKFTVQVAALKGLNDANHLKAKLLLLGFQDVNVRKREKRYIVLYRVTVGNFSNRKDAGLIQNKLKQKGIESLITRE